MFRSAALATASFMILTAPALAQAPAAAPESQIIAPDPSVDIVANLKASGQFTTLLKALDGSGLTPLLQKPGALTLFAPTDAAFAALPPGQLDELMKPTNAAQLQQVIAYHIVNTRLPADQIAGHAATPVPNVLNKPITVDGTSAPIKVNGVSVLQAGAPASNGVIYVIDKVLIAP